MTVATANNRNSYACNGSQVIFPYTFKIFQDSDLVVKLRDANGAETTLTLTTDYTVSGAGAAAGGNVTTVATYASGNQLIILRQIPLTQLVDYVENDNFPAETHEGALDRAVMITQQLNEEVGRAIKMPDSSPLAGADLEITEGVLANKVIGFDAAGSAVELKSTGTISNPDFYVIGDYNDDLAQAITDIGASNVTLLINKQVNVTADATVPSNIFLWFLKEGSFNISVGKTVTVASSRYIVAGRSRIAYGSGALVFTKGGFVYPEWWGAVDDSTADAAQQAINVTAFQAALDSQGEVSCGGDAYYRLNARIRMKSHTILYGAGKTRIVWTHNGVGIDFYKVDPPDPSESYITPGSERSEHWLIRDIALEGANNGYSAQVSGNHAVQVGQNTDAENAQAWGGENIERVIFFNWGDRAVNIAGNAYSTRVHKCRFEKVYDSVWVGTAVTACTGIQVKGNVYNNIGNDIFYQTGGDGPVFTGNITEANIKGYMTHFVTVDTPVAHSNRSEAIYRAGTKDFAHLWDAVVGGYFRGKGDENIHLDGASTNNDVKIVSQLNGWALSGGGITPVFVHEDTANGAARNRIRIVAYHTNQFIYQYGASSNAITSDITVISADGGKNSHPQILTNGTTNLDPSDGYYECDASGGAITINLPNAFRNPFGTYHFKVTNATANVTIVPSAVAPDTGKIDGVAANIVLTAVDDYIILRPKNHWAALGGAAPYSNHLAKDWESYGKKVT